MRRDQVGAGAIVSVASIGMVRCRLQVQARGDRSGCCVLPSRLCYCVPESGGVGKALRWNSSEVLAATVPLILHSE